MVFRFDRQIFFERFRRFEGPLSDKEVSGLNFLLDAVEMDRKVTRLEWFAYMLATTKHETAHTYQPIHEYGGRSYFIRRYGSQTAVGRQLGNDTPDEGAIYAGRGDVQLTGESNYERSEAALRREYPELIADFEARTGRHFDLTVGDQPGDHRDPDNAMDPAIAYAIMSFGMRTGLFTGKKLADYTYTNGFDAMQARRIINRMDKADVIASYYKSLLQILRASLIDDDAAMLSGSEIDKLTAFEEHNIGGQSDRPESDVSSLTAADSGAGAAEDEPQPDAALADPGNVETEFKQKETFETPTGERTVEQSTTSPAGDAPGVAPTSWLNLEDWKPFTARWLKRAWTAVGTVTIPGGSALGLAALNDPPNWFIYVAIAVVLIVIVLGIGVIVSAVLLAIWYFNRKEIAAGKTEAARSLIDPNLTNLGVIIEKK